MPVSGADILLCVNQHSTVSSRSRRTLRAASSSAALGLAAGVALLSSPAHADVPLGWSEPDEVSRLTVLWALVGIPVGLFLLITLLVYVPALVRGEKAGSAGGADPEWFGGPVKGTEELPAPDDENSKAGGASGRW